MSTTKLMNGLPKALRDELKTTQLYAMAFTDESRKTVKPTHAMLVPQGIEKMIENRQELLVLGYGQTPDTHVALLRDIEVLRYTLTLLDRETK